MATACLSKEEKWKAPTNGKADWRNEGMNSWHSVSVTIYVCNSFQPILINAHFNHFCA